MADRSRRIGVLMGGLSSEREVSLASGRAVAAALAERGWDVVAIDVQRDLPRRLLEAEVDVAWLALHGRFGEDGCVQGLLEVLGIPYTGSGVRASAVAMDKIATKRALAEEPEVRLAADWVLRPGDPLPEDLTLPVCVKPSVGGSTLGISRASTTEELATALEEAWSYDEDVLVEAFVEGEEITVAVLDGEPLPVVRICPDSGFFDFEAKYTKGRTRYECPAVLPEDVTRAAQVAARRAYVALGCRGLARADFIVPPQGDPVFLEINTLPGMTTTSLSPMAAGAAGISFGELVERLLEGAHRMEAEVEPGGADASGEVR